MSLYYVIEYLNKNGAMSLKPKHRVDVYHNTMYDGTIGDTLYQVLVMNEKEYAHRSAISNIRTIGTKALYVYVVVIVTTNHSVMGYGFDSDYCLNPDVTKVLDELCRESFVRRIIE